MILEVVDAGGVRARLRLVSLPLTVGRAPANDLILDDPYVDGRHARIALDEAGALVVEDLGSVNGLATPGTPGRAARLAAGPGVEVRLGRTVLRFRDPEEAVPPALPDRGEEPVAPGPARARWTSSTPARLGVAAAAAAWVAAYTWLENHARSSGSDVLAGAMVFATVAAVWAGIWAVAGRMAGQRSHFAGHLAVFSAATVAGMILAGAASWDSFLFPDAGLTTPLWLLAWPALAAATVAGHLSLASALPPRRRWRAGLGVAAAMLLFAGATALAADDEFSDVPAFAGVLKPLPARWIPMSDQAEFAGMADDLKKEVDELAAEE
ncbi:MAG: FHA domain-containing protein [Gemmatimonadota bacterium]